MGRTSTADQQHTSCSLPLQSSNASLGWWATRWSRPNIRSSCGPTAPARAWTGTRTTRPADAQCELVLCLDNDSDSRTEWIDAKGDQHLRVDAAELGPAVRAGDTGAAHRVIPLKTGERTILKMAWRPEW